MDDGFFLVSQNRSVTTPAREPLPLSLSPVGVGIRKMDMDWNTIPSDHVDVDGSWRMRSGTMTENCKTSRLLNASALSQRAEVLGSRRKRENRPKMELPPLPSLGAVNFITSTSCPVAQQDTVKGERSLLRSSPKARAPYSWAPASPTETLAFSSPFGTAQPLTPPQEADALKWTLSDSAGCPDRNSSLSFEADNSRLGISGLQPTASAGRPSVISLPGFVNMSEQSNSPSAWLERALETIISSNSTSSGNSAQVNMVVQALPSQMKNRAAKPVFQVIAEGIQQRAAQAPYITITHAVSQVVSMEEVPASPPATPNNQYGSDDYFDNQTIFTHAAVIPTYHGQSQTAAQVSTSPRGVIAAPSSITVSTLERYIPPTTGQEVDDFFSISRRSYLVDRLTELSAANGSLLLVYPTQVGGAVFARQYVSPVLDPFLRRFVLLNNLTTDAATALGKTAAVSSLKTFEEMEEGLKTLCRDLTSRAPGRGLHSEFHVIHAEKAKVVIDRMTWVQWFVEQETWRIRQDMIDYQKSGGRMPARGFDASPSSLAREVVEGIKNSREEAGGVGVEVGVFVIRRSVP